MRTIGLLGGMSWESTALYYRLINEGVRDRLGGVHSARCLLHSFDFAEVEALQAADDWDGAAALLVGAARGLEAAGADLLVVCTNTMHRVADALEAALDIPLVHIADATAEAVRADGVDTVGLLGTRYTMEGGFYAGRLRERHDLDVVVPDEADRALVHRIIYEELVRGVVTEPSRRAYLEVIERLAARGARGVILGCTEIELLVPPTSPGGELPRYPSTALHAAAAVDVAFRPAAA